MDELKCNHAMKLAGFKSKAQVAELAGISIRGLFDEFTFRFRWREKPKLPSTLRKAMDAKHMQERAVMEAAILKIMEKDVEND